MCILIIISHCYFEVTVHQMFDPANFLKKAPAVEKSRPHGNCLIVLIITLVPSKKGGFAIEIIVLIRQTFKVSCLYA